MALVKCSECGAKISDKAPKCPHCGSEFYDEEFELKQEQKQRTKRKIIVFVAVKRKRLYGVIVHRINIALEIYYLMHIGKSVGNCFFQNGFAYMLSVFARNICDKINRIFIISNVVDGCGKMLFVFYYFIYPGVVHIKNTGVHIGI